MSSGETVSIGSLSGVLAMRDEFSAQLTKLEARLKIVEDRTVKTSRTTKTETDKISAAYKKVAASLDPVVANTQKYERAEHALTAALRAGLITQDKYNQSLSKAKDKYLSASAHTLTWREDIHNLTNVMAPFASRIANVSVLMRDLTNAFQNSKKIVTENASAFGSLTAIVKPFIPLIASIAGVAVIAFAGFKIISAGINLVVDAVSTGLKTQLIIEKLNKSLAINGSAAGLSAKELVAYAEALELVTGRSKEEIVAAETILSRFDSLGKESFPRALEVSLALAKATGDTADASAKKLGPALEGNIRSLNTFREVGIVFTAAERKKMQAMVDTGEIIEYQALLFDLLEKKVGVVGDSMDKNLTRQSARAKIVMEDFGENIASQVIPALEDLVQELVDTAGGWENLKRTVSEIGSDIGNVIRTVIYSILIDYHTWEAATDSLISSLLSGFASMASAVGANTIAERLAAGADKAADSAFKHGKAVMESTNNLVKHRTALEGDSESHKKDKDVIDKHSGALDKLKSVLDSVNQAIDNYKQRAENARNLSMAATVGLKAYNAELLRQKVAAAIQSEENKLRAIGKRLTDDQRNNIAQAVIAEDQFTKATQRTLSAQTKLEAVTAKLAETMEKLFEAGAGGNDPAMQKLLDNLEEASQITADTRSDEEKRLDIVGRANELYSQGLISAASLQQTITDNADQWNVELSETQLLFIKISDRLSAIADNLAYDLIGAMADAAKRGESIWSAAGKSIKDSILSAVQDAISEWASRWARAMAEWLARWIATQRAGQVASASLQGPTQSGGNLSGVGTAGVSNSGASAGTMAGYALAAYALFVVYKGFIEDHKRKFGSVTISGGVTGTATGHGSKFIKQVQEAAAILLKSLAEFTKNINIDMEHYGSVILEASKAGFNVKFSPTSTGKLFKTIEEAQEYAQVLMLKYGTFADSVSFLVQSVIKSTKAINLEKLASDIDFARTLDTQNLESIAIDMKQALDLAIGQWNRAKELWTSIYDTNLPAFAEAAASIITRLSSSLQQQYNSLMGIKEDPKAAWQRQALAYNAQRAITLAQIKLWELEIAARIANYNATRTLVGGGGGGGGKGSGSGYIGVTQQFTKFVAAFVEASTDTIDAGLQALLDIQKLLQDAGASIPDAIDPTKYPGTKGGKGGGDNRSSVRDWIADKRYDLDTRSLDEWVKKAADIARQYDEQIRLSGKDKKLREDLLALKQRELDLLAKEQIDSTVESFKNFLSLVSPFDSVRKTAQDLIKQIEASPFGNDRKAKMIGRILAGLDSQIQALSDKMAGDLFGSLAGMLEDGVLKTDLLRAQFVLNYQLQLLDAKSRYAQLLMEGRLSEANRKLFEDAIRTLEGMDPSKLFNPSGSGGSSDSGTASGQAYNSKMERMAKLAEDYAKRMQAARDLLKKYTDQGLSPLARQLNEINADFKTITDALGNTPEIIREKNEAIARAYKDALEGIQDVYNSLLNGPASSLTIEKQYAAAKAKYESLVNEVSSGNYMNLDQLDSATQSFIDLLGQMYGTSTGGFEDERQKILSQLGELLKLGTSSGAGSGSGNNIIQFPYNDPANSPSLIGSSIVSATDNVGKVIDMRAIRQERLLTTIGDRLTELRVVLESMPTVPANSGLTLTYG